MSRSAKEGVSRTGSRKRTRGKGGGAARQEKYFSVGSAGLGLGRREGRCKEIERKKVKYREGQQSAASLFLPLRGGYVKRIKSWNEKGIGVEATYGRAAKVGSGMMLKGSMYLG